MATYNVKDYGARGDGRTDDRASMWKALKAAGEAGGGTIYIPKGTYIVSGGTEASDGGLELGDHIVITGDGMGDTVLRLAEGWSRPVASMIRTPVARAVRDAAIRDLTLDGQGAPAGMDGFLCGTDDEETGCDERIALERVEIIRMPGCAFRVRGRAGKLVFRDCIAHHNGQDGFAFAHLFNSLLEHNSAYANGGHGFHLAAGSHDITLRYSLAHDNGGSGFISQRGDGHSPFNRNIVFLGNAAHENGGHGIVIRMSTGAVAKDNEIYRNRQAGIAIEGAKGSIIETNLIYNNSQQGDGLYSQIGIARYDDTAGASKGYFHATHNLVRRNFVYSDTSLRPGHSICETGDGSRHNEVTSNLTQGARNEEIQVVNADIFVPAMSPVQADIKRFLGWP